MLHRSILRLGCLVSSGAIALASPAIAQPNIPVVRANGLTKQVPSCYIETTNSGLQNLEATCLMGKTPDPQMFDMVTDRNGDGIPDDLVPMFKQTNDLLRNSRDTPENRVSQGQQMQQMFQTMAKRAPVTAATRQNLRELGTVIATMSRFSQDTPTDASNFLQQYQRLEQLSKQLNSDPVISKINDYSRRYTINQAMKK